MVDVRDVVGSDVLFHFQSCRQMMELVRKSSHFSKSQFYVGAWEICFFLFYFTFFSFHFPTNNPHHPLFRLYNQISVACCYNSAHLMHFMMFYVLYYLKFRI